MRYRRFAQGDEVCDICGRKIRRGEFKYVEVISGKVYCEECVRKVMRGEYDDLDSV